jgi:hypothetical protein
MFYWYLLVIFNHFMLTFSLYNFVKDYRNYRKLNQLTQTEPQIINYELTYEKNYKNDKNDKNEKNDIINLETSDEEEEEEYLDSDKENYSESEESEFDFYTLRKRKRI